MEKVQDEPKVNENSISKNDIEFLENVFAAARKHVADDENQLVALINGKRTLFEKLSNINKILNPTKKEDEKNKN